MIENKKNSLIVTENLGISGLRRFSSALYHMVEKHGYKEIILDFKGMVACFQDFMVPICAIVVRYRGQGVSFKVQLPTDSTLQNLFINSNWAHYMGSGHPLTPVDQFVHVPLQQFKTLHEQNQVVNEIIKSVLSRVGNIERGDIAALEWTLNEITDNVLTHSQSVQGGFAQCTVFNRKIEIVVCDQGLGIPGTLKRTQPNITNDRRSLEYAIRKGVTRDKSIGQGNGLFGAWEITRLCEGEMSINSGRAFLYRKNGLVKIEDDEQRFVGTLVVWSINLGYPDLLSKALSFGEKPYVYVDFLELNYEDEENAILFKLSAEADSVGARLGSEHVRTRIRNLLHIYQNKSIVVDFEGYNLVSSSFADEVIAKLMLEIGPVAFFHRIRFRNVNDLTVQIIDRAIIQRIKESG